MDDDGRDELVFMFPEDTFVYKAGQGSFPGSS